LRRDHLYVSYEKEKEKEMPKPANVRYVRSEKEGGKEGGRRFFPHLIVQQQHLNPNNAYLERMREPTEFEGRREGVIAQQHCHLYKPTLTSDPEAGRCDASSTHAASISAISSGCHCMSV